MRQRFESGGTLPEALADDIAAAIAAALPFSMGTDITDEDLTSIQSLASQVLELGAMLQELTVSETAEVNVIDEVVPAALSEAKVERMDNDRVDMMEIPLTQPSAEKGKAARELAGKSVLAARLEQL